MMRNLRPGGQPRRFDLHWSFDVLSKLPPGALADIRHCTASALNAEAAVQAGEPHPLIRSYNLHKWQVRRLSASAPCQSVISNAAS